MKRKFPVLYMTRDLDQHLWYVRQERETKHGFSLLFGSPDSPLGGGRGGPIRLIATQELRQYWEKNKAKLRVTFDLPAGRTTLKRVRSRLGFHWRHDADQFYVERAEDLAKLNETEFAAKHNIYHPNALSARRMQILGRRARQRGWWQKPKTIELLRSGLTLREISEKLGISTSQVFRLRRVADCQPGM